MILDRHWWYTADRRLVPNGDPGAAVLAYPSGMEIPDATAVRLGILPADQAPPAVKETAAADERLLAELDGLKAENERLLAELDEARKRVDAKAADKPADKARAKTGDK